MIRTTSKKRQPIYQRVVSQLTLQINKKVYLQNDRLPSVRELMRHEKISHNTAVRVFQELEMCGIVYAKYRSGYFVCPQKNKTMSDNADIQNKQTSQPINVAVNQLVVDVLKKSNQEDILAIGSAVLKESVTPNALLNRTLRSIANNVGSHARYIPPPGFLDLRCHIARIMTDRGVICNANEILITSGDSIATEFALRAITQPGDLVAIESPTYFGILQTIESCGLKAVEIPTHKETGINIASLMSAINSHNICCVLLNPTLHNPMGYTMSNNSRQELVDYLQAKKIPIIEDDVFFDLYNGEIKPRAIKSFDQNGTVVYCSSFSKTITPGYRIGWCLPGIYYNKILDDIYSKNISISSLPQMILSDFIRKGYYLRHCKKLRDLFSDYGRKISSIVAQHFPEGTEVSQPCGGFIFWVEPPLSVDAEVIYEAALAEGIAITPGKIFTASSNKPRAFRICVGRQWTPEIERAIVKLGLLCRRFQFKNTYIVSS